MSRATFETKWIDTGMGNKVMPLADFEGYWLSPKPGFDSQTKVNGGTIAYKDTFAQAKDRIWKQEFEPYQSAGSLDPVDPVSLNKLSRFNGDVICVEPCAERQPLQLRLEQAAPSPTIVGPPPSPILAKERERLAPPQVVSPIELKLNQILEALKPLANLAKFTQTVSTPPPKFVIILRNQGQKSYRVLIKKGNTTVTLGWNTKREAEDCWRQLPSSHYYKCLTHDHGYVKTVEAYLPRVHDAITTKASYTRKPDSVKKTKSPAAVSAGAS